MNFNPVSEPNKPDNAQDASARPPEAPTSDEPTRIQPKRQKRTRLTNRRTIHACSNPDCDWQGIRFSRRQQLACPKCAAPVIRPRRSRLTLTPREHRLIKEYADPQSPTFANGTKSAIKAGYSPKTATSSASETLAKPKVREALVREIHAHGGSLKLVGKRVAEGLSANQTRVFLSKDGSVVYSEALVDYDQRRKYAELAARFEGALPTPQEQERIALLQIQQTFNLVPPVADKRKEIEIEGTVEE